MCCCLNRNQISYVYAKKWSITEVMIESALDAIKQKISVKMHLPQSSLLVFLTLLIFF